MLFKLLDFFHTPVQQERTCNHKVTECKISLYSCVSDDNYRNWGKNPTAFIDVPAKHVSTCIQVHRSELVSSAYYLFTYKHYL